MSAVGIPTYGVPGAWGDHDGRVYLFDLVKALAQ
jgi:hypothetical protein